MNNENNINIINVYFQIKEYNDKYDILVDKYFEFIKVIRILFSKYPELESNKMGAFIFNEEKFSLFGTLFENEIIDGSIILIDRKNN